MSKETDNLLPTHTGTIFGIPIYLHFFQPLEEGENIITDDATVVWVRHWALSPILTALELLFGCAIYVRSCLDEDYIPAYPIKITGVWGQ